MASVPRVVLVHGAWHGAWCWERVVRALERRGVEAHALDLPGHGESRERLGGLHDDARAVRAALDQLEGPALVCGHSYGGCVITEAAAGHPAAAHLVYLAAFMPDVGESLAALIQSAPPDVPPDEHLELLLPQAIVPGADGMLRIDPALAAAAFYGDCDPVEATDWVARLGPQAGASFTDRATRAAWRAVPSTYIACTRDRALSPALQRRLSSRAGERIEWASDHSPFWHRSEPLAELLATRAAGAVR